MLEAAWRADRRTRTQSNIRVANEIQACTSRIEALHRVVGAAAVYQATVDRIRQEPNIDPTWAAYWLLRYAKISQAWTARAEELRVDVVQVAPFEVSSSLSF